MNRMNFLSGDKNVFFLGGDNTHTTVILVSHLFTLYFQATLLETPGLVIYYISSPHHMTSESSSLKYFSSMQGRKWGVARITPSSLFIF